MGERARLLDVDGDAMRRARWWSIPRAYVVAACACVVVVGVASRAGSGAAHGVTSALGGGFLKKPWMSTTSSAVQTTLTQYDGDLHVLSCVARDRSDDDDVDEKEDGDDERVGVTWVLDGQTFRDARGRFGRGSSDDDDDDEDEDDRDDADGDDDAEERRSASEIRQEERQKARGAHRLHSPHRVTRAAGLVASTIERYFPSRLRGRNGTFEPFEVVFEVSDAPSSPCLQQDYALKHCDFEQWAPIFAFGSAPKDAKLLPPLVPSTLSVLEKCFGRALKAKRFLSDEPVCDFLSYPEIKYSEAADCDNPDAPSRAACRYHGLFSIDAVDDEREYAWDNLIPRVVWRGSDYVFLSKNYEGFKGNALEALRDIAASSNTTRAMESYVKSPDIGPRLRAVLMSKLKPSKFDARFFNWGGTSAPNAEERSALGKHLGVDADKHLGEVEFGRYKYHLDLGGGGGTTWSGVIPKLSMPGVLFHHETIMKDSYFDSLLPWVHYVPIREDASDLEEKLAWAEHHPHQTRQISLNADAWVRNFRRAKNLLRHNYEKLAKPLGERVLKGYLIPFERAHADPKTVRVRERAALASVRVDTTTTTTITTP